jgi:hypothetical protein
VAVEGDVVVPVAVGIAESRICRPHHSTQDHRHLQQFLVPCPRYRPKRSSVDIGWKAWTFPIEAVLDDLDIDTSGARRSSPFFKGGPGEAKRRLRRFIAHP